MFSKFFIDRPIFAWVIALIILLAGGLALRQLPVPALIERSRDGRLGNGGASQEWRAGRPEWRNLILDLSI